MTLCEQLTFLDTDTGMVYCCDSEEFYREMLRSYQESSKYQDMQRAYDSGDWENYRILVHAMKSTSLSIGAAELSEQFRALELAAKEGNTACIQAKHGNVMRAYLELLERLEKVLCRETPQNGEAQQPESMAHILVIDDDRMILQMAEKILRPAFRVSCVQSGQEALDFLQEHTPHLILLDLHMPEMSGFEVITQLKETERVREIPVIFLSGDDDSHMEIKGFELGALDFIRKPFVAAVMMRRINRILELDRLQKHLQQEVERQTAIAEERRARMERLSLQIVQALASTIDAKDKYTNGHSERVARYAREIARRLGKSEKEQEDIYYMGLLHDIGKIGIPDEIINKTSRLTDEEYQVIRTHPVIGSDILKNISEMPQIATGARWHHERYDGKGYPDGLAGKDIPCFARIIGVADAYDAMTSRRSYREMLSQEAVREEIRRGRGSQFDPEYADVMLQMIAEDTEYKLHD